MPSQFNSAERRENNVSGHVPLSTEFRIGSPDDDVKPLSEISGRTSARVSAVVLLGGGLTPSPLTAAMRCSVLDLTIRPAETVFQRWMLGLQTLDGLAMDPLPVIVAAGGGIAAPRLPATPPGLPVRLVQNTREFRGAAGVVQDVTADLPPESLLLVAEAARFPEFDLTAGIRVHLSSGLGATVFVNPDNSPAGVYLLTRDLLRFVQQDGFMDLKEQWLQRVVESGHQVGVYQIDSGDCLPLRTREQALLAARWALHTPSGLDETARFQLQSESASISRFQCIAPSAEVDPSAVVIDSIVMPGATIGASAVIARSIVCANCRVPAETILIDKIQVAAGPSGDRPARELQP